MLSKDIIDKNCGGKGMITDCVIKQILLLIGDENQPSKNVTCMV